MPQYDTNSSREWATASDAVLLAACEIDTYRASGPGGQKRNKTSSAVRLRHIPTGLIVIAEESRSQHENKAKALRRLRQAFHLELREPGPFTAESLAVDAVLLAIKDAEGRVDVSPRNAAFWPAAGLILDVFESMQAQVSTAAEMIGVSTANLVDFLQSDPKLWQAANRLRVRHGHKMLKSE
jgi:hypothetical protein